LNDPTVAFLKAAYKQYYFKSADSIVFTDDVPSREFGYIPFGRGMVRHLSFKSKGEAKAEIVRQAPSSAYCSNAKYESPASPMEEKGWKGAELIFDIDATDVQTACKKSHDVWYCSQCHASGKLPKPQLCTVCKKPSTEAFHGTCEVCLAAAKDHTLRVVDFLTSDFGVKRDAIKTFFSGNRGYHLHVFDDRFFALDQGARLDIAEYVLGSSLPPSSTIWSVLKRTKGDPTEELGGWYRRIALLVGSGRTDTGRPSFSIASAIASQSARIDASVTTDIHRVFRMGGTLHGTSGMLKMPVESMDRFDPERDPVVLSAEKASIKVAYFPKFTMKGEQFGPYTDQTVSIPTYAAVGILTRGLGEVV